MKGKPTAKQAAPPLRQAPPEEIGLAIDALTDEDNERIERLAINRITRIGQWAAAGRTDADLIQEAVIRLLDGRRNWNPDNTSFVQCFAGVVRSIASEWAGHRKRNQDSPEYADSESLHRKNGEEGKTIALFDTIRSEVLNAEERAVADANEADQKASAEAILDAFADDEPATFVLWGWEEGKDGPTICQECDFTEKQFRAITRRIQRRAQKIMDDRYGK